MRNYFLLSKKLLSIIDKKFIDITFLVFLFLFGSLLELLSLGIIFPYVKLIINPEILKQYSYIFSFTKNYSYQSFFLFFTILLIFLFIIKTLMSILIKWLIISFSQKQLKILQVKLLQAYQNMNYLEFTQRNKSEYIRNLREFSYDCLQGIESLLRIISEGIVLIAISFYLAYINPSAFASLAILFVFTYLIFNAPLKKKLIFYGQRKNEGRKKIYQNITEAFNGFKELRVLMKEKFFRDLIDDAAENVCKNEIKQSLISVSPRYIFELLIVFFVLIFTLISIYNNKDLNILIPTIGVFAVAGLRVLPAGAEIMAQIARVDYVSNGINVTFNDLSKFGYSVEKNNTKKIEDNSNYFSSVELKNVAFRYPNSSTYVLKNLNLKIQKNDFIGIVGESGVGKSTFVDIILGLITPQEGEVIINKNTKIKDQSDWSGSVAYLPQNDLILDHDLKTNISLIYDPKKQDKIKLQEAIKNSNLDKFLETLPNGLDTKIGENGIRLSGGQDKRIALARTFYHNKEVIVLDEATSSLDKDTESRIVEQIGKLKNKKTIIIISHRMTTLKYCDKIYEIKNQNISEIKK